MTTQPDSVVAEGYRSLRSAVNFLGHIRHAVLNPQTADGLIDAAPEVIVLAGPRGGDGKTTTAANLAVALAEGGKSVVVIDCDFRNPQVQNFFGAGAAVLGSEHLLRQTPIQGVEVITAARSAGDPGAMLRRLPELIGYARSRADVVLIDSGPLLVVSDAVDLLAHADAVVVTCRVGRTTPEQASRARMMLARANVPLAGTVLLGAAGPGNRSSLSEPMAWSRARKPVRAPLPVAPAAAQPVTEAPAPVPPQVHLPAQAGPIGYPWAASVPEDVASAAVEIRLIDVTPAAPEPSAKPEIQQRMPSNGTGGNR
jgi:Mrp family chromosome partitioning ATPase